MTTPQQVANLKKAFAEHDIPWPRLRAPRTLYFNHLGPMIRYDGEMLLVDDLNPEVSTKWRMSRSEMFRLGWHCIVAAVRP